MFAFKGEHFFVYHGWEGEGCSLTGLRMLRPGLLQTRAEGGQSHNLGNQAPRGSEIHSARSPTKDRAYYAEMILTPATKTDCGASIQLRMQSPRPNDYERLNKCDFKFAWSIFRP